MDAILFEQLLYQEESDSLDFKRDQYPFDGEIDDVKSELLKDILAFANSWKQTDRYILIGVEDVKGGKSIVKGITNDLDDAKLQQFVNSKTNKPINFSYQPFIFDEKRVGIIKISVQQRPFYLKKNYGKLAKEIVKIRRGSSTGEAELDEIALMGVDPAVLLKPSIDLEFADINSKEKLNNKINLKSILLNYEETQIKKIAIDPISFIHQQNPDYYVEKAKYIRETSLLNKIGFWIKNTGEMHLTNVSLKIYIKHNPKIVVIDEIYYPSYPKKQNNFLPNYAFKPNSVFKKNRIDVDFENRKTNQRWLISADFGDIRPKEEVWSSDFFCVGAYEALELELEGIVLADNITEPIKLPLSITFNVDTKKLDIEKLY